MFSCVFQCYDFDILFHCNVGNSIHPLHVAGLGDHWEFVFCNGHSSFHMHIFFCQKFTILEYKYSLVNLTIMSDHLHSDHTDHHGSLFDI